MEEKTFYIVPNTKGYYETKKAASKEDALVNFAETMDMDMSAYFKAVDEEPVTYPHGYEYPEGKFELALAIIMADAESEYYTEGIRNGLNPNWDILSNLQRTYEELKKVDSHTALKSRKYFYKVLRDITGFRFDKNEQPAPDDIIRIHIRNMKPKKVFEALGKKHISYDMDSGERIMISRSDLKCAEKALTKANIEYDII